MLRCRAERFMILKRLAEAMRELKWTTVVIELMIVVLGIFIGLQVDGWNEYRKDRIEEQVILTRLGAEIAIAIEDVRRDIDELQVRIDNANYVIAKLIDGTPPEDNDQRFASGLIGAARIEMPFSGMSTIQELQNTGKIMLILDGDVRSAISRLEDTYRKAETYVGFVAVRLTPLSATIDTHVRRIGSDWDDVIALEYDFDELVAAKKLRFALSNLASFLTDNKAWMEQHLMSLEALQEVLGKATEGA